MGPRKLTAQNKLNQSCKATSSLGSIFQCTLEESDNFDISTLAVTLHVRIFSDKIKTLQSFGIEPVTSSGNESTNILRVLRIRSIDIDKGMVREHDRIRSTKVQASGGCRA